MASDCCLKEELIEVSVPARRSMFTCCMELASEGPALFWFLSFAKFIMDYGKKKKMSLSSCSSNAHKTFNSAALLSLPVEVLREAERKDGIVSLETGSPVFRWLASTGASLEKSEECQTSLMQDGQWRKMDIPGFHTLVLPLAALRHCATFLASLKWSKVILTL